jgi:RNA polymerase sigma-70 factor (ECF subfamily)
MILMKLRMLRRKPSLKPIARLRTFAEIAPFIHGYTALPSIRQKNHLVARGRRPPDSDVSSEDAEFYEGDHALKDIESPERALLRDEIEDTVHRTIQQLPEDLRTALTLREFDGLSYEDIANVMQCPVGTVRSRIFRAREAIDKALQPLLHES